MSAETISRLYSRTVWASAPSPPTTKNAAVNPPATARARRAMLTAMVKVRFMSHLLVVCFLVHDFTIMVGASRVVMQLHHFGRTLAAAGWARGTRSGAWDCTMLLFW